MIYKGNPEVYSCYSPKLHEFLKEFGIEPFDEFVNIKNHKKCWVYSVDDKLSTFLTQWSVNKSNMQNVENQ